MQSHSRPSLIFCPSPIKCPLVSCKGLAARADAFDGWLFSVTQCCYQISYFYRPFLLLFFFPLYFNAFVLLKTNFQALLSDNYWQRLHASLSPFLRRKDLFGLIIYLYIIFWFILIFLLKFLFKLISVLGYLRPYHMLINSLQNCGLGFPLSWGRVTIFLYKNSVCYLNCLSTNI